MTKLTFRKIISVVLAVVTAVISIPVAVHKAGAVEKEGYCYYTVSYGKATFTGADGSSGITEVVIPDTLGGYPVTSISGDAFYGWFGLTAITIPKSVTSIGEDAFFWSSKITRVNISDIEAWCNIDFGNHYSNPFSVTYEVCDLYLNGELVTELVIPDSITKIKDYTFYDCEKITSLTLPDNIQSIGDNAFNGCIRLMDIYIPDSLYDIGDNAFYNCKRLENVYYSGSKDSWNKKVEINSGNEYLTSATIHYNVTDVDNHYEYIESEPTCTEQGFMGYICPCGYTIDAEYTPETGHTGGTATCAKGAVCDICGEEYGDIDAANHTGETEIRDVVEPTTDTEGYTGDTYCKDCGNKIAAGEVIPVIETPETSVGDVNDDGAVNLDDVIRLLQYIAGWNVELGK